MIRMPDAYAAQCLMCDCADMMVISRQHVREWYEILQTDGMQAMANLISEQCGQDVGRMVETIYKHEADTSVIDIELLIEATFLSIIALETNADIGHNELTMFVDAAKGQGKEAVNRLICEYEQGGGMA